MNITCNKCGTTYFDSSSIDNANISLLYCACGNRWNRENGWIDLKQLEKEAEMKISENGSWSKKSLERFKKKHV